LKLARPREGSLTDFKGEIEFFIFARDSEQAKSGLSSFLI
jgi:hypothetical protein